VKKIRILLGDGEVEAMLNESDTAGAVWDALPIEGWANRWGEEIYFEIPVSAELAADARTEMEVGEMAYWPVGRAFCVFFGPTPASKANEPRAYSPVNPLGKVSGDVKPLHDIQDGQPVKLLAADQP
jgi:hypothetical protein